MSALLGCVFLGYPSSGGGMEPGDIVSSDGSVAITPSGGGVNLSVVWAPALAVGTSVSNLVTSTAPGAGPPTNPPYPGSQTWFSLGSQVSPIVLSAGTWEVLLTYWAEVSAANAAIWLDMFVNGQPSELGPSALGPTVTQLGSAGAQDVRSGATVTVLGAPAPFWLEIRVAKDSGSGSVTFKQGSIIVRRLG